ncbi:hypothetical protein H6P81_009410 [Aristolochia fimbriata]|uniref:ARM repeat superfamily protein n=1 Tax=Aristolochia fimbriata TaxID=158543 RepID=A0AAV7EKU5_ARIFI|nr:hypothetical protein H6P81_009410 [Aristolochia fimbriata]
MEEQIWKSNADSLSSSSPSPLGRVMNSIISSRPKRLQAAISRADCPSERNSEVSLDDALRYIREHARGAVMRGETLDGVLIPVIENALNHKGSKHGKQVFLLFHWLFQDELLIEPLSSNLAEIIFRKEDSYISLGWCFLVRGLVENELNQDNTSERGNLQWQKMLLKCVFQSIPRLLPIVCKGSILQDGFELPSRLSLAMADCILVLSRALVQEKRSFQVPNKSCTELLNLSRRSKIVAFESGSAVGGNKRSSLSEVTQGLEDMEMELLLWNHSSELIIIVEKLLAWNRKSRLLHAKGLELVLKWLQGIKVHYTSLKDEAGEEMLKTGLLLLSSCWKHYGRLLQLEDHKFAEYYKELLEQYISGIQFCSQDISELPEKRNGGVETKRFFLICLCLLWGRLGTNQLEMAMSEYGQQMTQLLLLQLQCSDEGVAEVALIVLRAIIFKTSFSSGASYHDSSEMDEVLPVLLNLLDERDSTSGAVVLLLAEYCSENPDEKILQEIFKRLNSGKKSQRKNAFDVIAEIIHNTSDSGKQFPNLMLKDISRQLLGCLGDGDPMIQARVPSLLSRLDPSFVLPSLVHRSSCPDERANLSASDAILEVLKYHNKNVDVVFILLDCIRDLHEAPDPPGTSLENTPSNPLSLQAGTKLDIDRVFCLIPKWAESVQNWTSLIAPLIEKMFAEPSNAIIVRFLSHISENLAEARDVVFQRVLVNLQMHDLMDVKCLANCIDEASTTVDSTKLKGSLFDRLCPLLILRLLPLGVFNELNSSLMYGQLQNQSILCGESGSGLCINNCIAAFLLKRASCSLEFEEVRKLAAELCGRLQPQVLLPIIISQMDIAAHVRDIMKLKSCLFTVCTSLVVRGKDSASHPAMVRIKQVLEKVLLWPSVDSNEVSKAQHGCIDCFALMICTELQISLPSTGSTHISDALGKHLVLCYVIQRLTLNQSGSGTHGSGKNMVHMDSRPTIRAPDTTEGLAEKVVPIPFRLCMANVLISVCQKISSSSKNSFARAALPVLIPSIKMMAESEVRAACLQVLFSAVYHLKSAVLPYSSELFKLSIRALKKGSEQEKSAGVKLMASLMSSEDKIVESIAGGLLEAKEVLAGTLTEDASPELKELCRKLLVCITPH